MLLSVTTKNTVLCMPKIMPKVFIRLNKETIFSWLNLIHPSTPIPPSPPPTSLISTFNEVKLARNKRHTEVQKIIFCS